MQVLNQKQLDSIKNTIAIQCSEGNWNADPYMLGMANGMLLIQSIIDNTEPEYLKGPKKWTGIRSLDIVRENPYNDKRT